MTDALREIARRVFVPPEPPDFGLGWAGRLSGAEAAARKAFEAAYWVGVAQGVTVGALASLAVVVVLLVVRGGPRVKP